MYTPLVVLIVIYVLLSFMANRARGHEDRAQAERYANIAFGVVLVSAAYVVVLLIATVFSYPSRFSRKFRSRRMPSPVRIDSG